MTDTVAAVGVSPGNVAGDVRAQLRDVLAPCLPGRVYAYAPDQVAAAVAPALWIDGHDGGRSNPFHIVTFNVQGVADGAGHAAQAMIDELLSAVSTALGAPGHRFALAGWATGLFDVGGEVSLRGISFNVDGPLAAVTFCPPVPFEALVPPEVITP
jgi:hypothetical protein